MFNGSGINLGGTAYVRHVKEFVIDSCNVRCGFPNVGASGLDFQELYVGSLRCYRPNDSGCAGFYDLKVKYQVICVKFRTNHVSELFRKTIPLGKEERLRNFSRVVWRRNDFTVMYIGEVLIKLLS